MNSGPTQVCMVSAYGRGNWLAAALREKSVNVKLIDVSPKMGRWAPEDWEGPFGFFQSDQIKALQLERLNEQDYFDTVDQGFTVWLKDGPIDLKGPLSSFLLEKAQLKEVADEMLAKSYVGNFDELTAALAKYPFSKTWIVYLAYYLAANEFTVGDFSFHSPLKPLPLFSPFNVRRVSRRGQDKSLDWCEEKGVEVLRDANIVDISFSSRSCEGIEVESAWSGVVKADEYIWMLTGEETTRFSQKVVEGVFPKGVIESSWSWLRYRVALGEGFSTSTLPVKFVMINDVYLPWSHENLCLVQRSVSGNDLDAWIRVPSQHRFQRNYLEVYGDKICKELENRIPMVKPEILDMPQDYHYNEADLGPNPFPIYDSTELHKFKLPKYKNLFFDSPENWGLLEWNGQFAAQQKLLNKLLQLNNNKHESAKEVSL